ncbi:MAG: hypothetical protein BWY69_01844 [Planctomycetes bacterium ADurb.Bin401]|nr:MAG: hypothetical protein BWY69_01844 [Planctomycetes bacterium ADurb.Bin401]
MKKLVLRQFLKLSLREVPNGICRAGTTKQSLVFKLLQVPLIFILIIASNAFAIDLKDWKYVSQISFAEPSEYYSLELTPQIYDLAKKDLFDLRIIDANGLQVPYIIVRPHDIARRTRFSPTIINRSTTPQNASLITLDFGSQLTKNSLDVITKGTSFRRAVKIEGSNDNINFFIVVSEAFVFAVEDKNFSRFNEIEMPANDYRYLRITVYPMPDEKNAPMINDVQAFINENKPAPRTTIAIRAENYIEDHNENLNIYEYDLSFKNLPISEIQLSFADLSFYRQVTIEGRNAAKRRVRINSEDNRERYEDVNENWNYVTGSVVYRYVSSDGKVHHNAALPISSAYRYLRFIVRNYDDRPLKLLSAFAEMTPHKLIFSGQDFSLPLSLYVGCQSASKPQYDLVQKISNPLELPTAPAIAEMVTDNPLFAKSPEKPIPWTEKHKSILFIALIAIVLIVGAYMLKSFKSIKQTPQEQKKT